jgi:hypothetical protein
MYIFEQIFGAHFFVVVAQGVKTWSKEPRAQGKNLFSKDYT